MGSLSEAGLPRFCAALEAACGLAYAADKTYLFDARLGAIVARHRVTTYAQLAELFERDPAARREVIEALVTSETYFFRDDAIFHRLPELLARLRPTPGAPAVIWSLGCATGQELWSILFALAEDQRLPPAALLPIGVDISTRALARAEAAVYSDFEVGRGLDEARRRRFLEPHEGGWRVARPWRELPRWVQGNLREGLDHLPRPDVVFCRNVLIYFDDALKRAIMGAIAARLAPGGFVVLGNAEGTRLYDDLFVQEREAGPVLRPLGPNGPSPDGAVRLCP